MENEKKRNELITIYVEDDMVYAQPKENLSKKELHILIGMLDEVLDFLKSTPKRTKGKQKWLN